MVVNCIFKLYTYIHRYDISIQFVNALLKPENGPRLNDGYQCREVLPNPKHTFLHRKF